VAARAEPLPVGLSPLEALRADRVDRVKAALTALGSGIFF